MQAAETGLTAAREALTAAEQRAEATRASRQEAERAVEGARRAAAEAGAELAAVNQFLRSHAGAPGGAPALADDLHAEAGYELALAAVLGRRLRAAIAPDLKAGAALLDQAGRDGGSAIVAPSASEAGARGATPPVPGARPLLDHVRGEGDAGRLASALLADAWVVDALEALPDDFRGVAVTRDGRVWFGAWRELRQVPAGGTDRVLAERNRRDELIAASEEAVGGEQRAVAAVEAATAAVAEADAARETAYAAVREAGRTRDDAVEREGRAAWRVELRRSAPDEGPSAMRRAQVQAEITAEERVAERAGRVRLERTRRIEALRAGIARDQALGPAAERLAAALEAAGEAVAARVAALDEELAADRQAGEQLAADLRACAHEEAELQARLRREGEEVTQAEVRAQQVRDHAAEVDAELRGLAQRLGLEPEAATAPLPAEEREQLEARLERLARRREQLGPVNPLAKAEYEEAVAHVEELETQRADLEAALRELEGLIKETDRRIREAFEETFAAAASNFEETVEHLFPGGRGRLRLVRRTWGPSPCSGARTSRRTRRQRQRQRRSASRGDGRSRGHDRRRDRDHPGRQVDEAPVAALRRREVAHGAGVPLRRLPRAAVPVLHPRRGRGRARRPQHLALPRAAAPLLRPRAVHRRHPPEAHHGGGRLPLRRVDERRRRLEGHLAATARGRRGVRGPVDAA